MAVVALHGKVLGIGSYEASSTDIVPPPTSIAVYFDTLDVLSAAAGTG
jgi:hypothetical protein